MDQARLQGSNLGCSEEGREVLASVQSLRSAPNAEPAIHSATLGTRTEQNPYTAELTAIAMAMAMAMGKPIAATPEKTDHYLYEQSGGAAGGKPAQTSIRPRKH